MIKSAETLSQVKANILKMQEKAVEVTLDLGRNKIVKFYGKLNGVYPALFTVVPKDKSFKGKTSYSYAEYMCGRVKLNLIENSENTQA